MGTIWKHEALDFVRRILPGQTQEHYVVERGAALEELGLPVAKKWLIRVSGPVDSIGLPRAFVPTLRNARKWIESHPRYGVFMLAPVGREKTALRGYFTITENRLVVEFYNFRKNPLNTRSEKPKARFTFGFGMFPEKRTGKGGIPLSLPKRIFDISKELAANKLFGTFGFNVKKDNAVTIFDYRPDFVSSRYLERKKSGK
ncbi:MAG: hypothetical protein V1835_07125 [Candidatus Micrarchaeota archaeon]